MAHGRLPAGRVDFLIIGAAKSATTWLQHSLMLDPRIRMPGPELHYFSREFARGDDWYLDALPARETAAAVGEKSNSYLDTPEAAARIKAALPEVRLVVQLRNPVARAYSDYCMLYRRGEVSGDIERYLDPRRAADGRFLASGRYREHLDRFLDLFGPEPLLVTVAEDVGRDPSGIVAAVKRHVGLSAEGEQAVAGVVKDKRAPLVDARLRRVLAPLKPIVAPLRGTRPFGAARSLVAREVRYPPLSEGLASRLADFYRGEAEAVSALVGRDLTGWLRASGEKLA